MPSSRQTDEGLNLAAIATRWSRIGDPAQFVIRYAPAVRTYLVALLGDPHDADDVCQEFLLRFSQHGLSRVQPDRGRFRDYLIAAVRNAALTFIRRRRSEQARFRGMWQAAETEDRAQAALGECNDQWRQCVLDRAWRELKAHQRKSPGNLCHDVLVITAEFPEEDAARQTARLAERAGVELRVDAFRKQRSRARRLFAETIAAEVAATLASPTVESVEAELIELGLWEAVREHLPPDWRTRQG